MFNQTEFLIFLQDFIQTETIDPAILGEKISEDKSGNRH